jgi:hypothetical protein
MTEVCLRRKSDGLYYVGKGRFTTAPKFVASQSKAQTIIRVDLGADLTEYDILTRAQMALSEGLPK